MTDATPEQLDLARKIADRIYPPQMVGLSCRENTLNASARIASLAAIIETTERNAATSLADQLDAWLHTIGDQDIAYFGTVVLAALRNQEHLKND